MCGCTPSQWLGIFLRYGVDYGVCVVRTEVAVMGPMEDRIRAICLLLW